MRIIIENAGRNCKDEQCCFLLFFCFEQNFLNEKTMIKSFVCYFFKTNMASDLITKMKLQ